MVVFAIVIFMITQNIATDFVSIFIYKCVSKHY